MLPALLLVPLAGVTETVITAVVTTIAVRLASDIYDAATNKTEPPAADGKEDLS